MSQTFRALSLKSLQTTSNASTHTLFLSLRLEPTKIVGHSVQKVSSWLSWYGGFLYRWQTAGGGSIPRWSAGKPQVVTRQKAKGADQKKSWHSVQILFKGDKNQGFLSKLQTGFQSWRNSQKRSTEDQKLSFGSQTVEIFPKCSNNVRFTTTSQLSTRKRDKCNRSVGCARGMPMPPGSPTRLEAGPANGAEATSPTAPGQAGVGILQRRPAHAKPDFNWLSGPRNGTWKRTCGISCLCSLASMRRLQCSTTQATFTNPSLLRAYSATPWYVLIQLPNVIDTISKRWRSKKAFNTSPFHIFS